MTELRSSKPRRWPRRLLAFLVFLILWAGAFLTLGSLLFEIAEASWARWLTAIAASLVGPIVLASLVAGRAREERVMRIWFWSLFVLLALGAGLPWAVATRATRDAVARHGLWAVEQVAGPRSAETRASWHRFFASEKAALATPAPAAPAPAGPAAPAPAPTAPAPAPTPAPTPAPPAPPGR
jgi:hypothetical protein